MPGDGDSGSALLAGLVRAGLGVAEGTAVSPGAPGSAGGVKGPWFLPVVLQVGMERGPCIPLGCSGCSCPAQVSPGQATVTDPVLGVLRAPGKGLGQEEAQGGEIQPGALP